MTTSNPTSTTPANNGVKAGKETTGLRRAALLLLMIEEESAAEVFKHFAPNQIQKSVRK